MAHTGIPCHPRSEMDAVGTWGWFVPHTLTTDDRRYGPVYLFFQGWEDNIMAEDLLLPNRPFMNSFSLTIHLRMNITSAPRGRGGREG